ncbi:MAG: aquaporin family protein [Pyrinomonadaceae bacterium]|nr:aquaporin family protein [Pyrinomonadaceae bacterium]
MKPFLGEMIGTALMILLGGGVVANVVLNKTKGNNSGWIVITTAWAFAVFVGVFVSGKIGSLSHLNPAVTISMASLGKLPWADAPTYIFAQILGAMIGSGLVWGMHRLHFDETDDADSKRGVFCTAPAIRSTFDNLLSEIIGTFVLIFGILYISGAAATLGSLEALPVSLLVLVIGLSLGGTTGYAINPARDLGPRIMHAILPIKDKEGSDWDYAWIPVIGPIVGALLAAFCFKLLQ